MLFQNILLQVLTVQKNKVTYYTNVPASFAYYTLKRESSTRKNEKRTQWEEHKLDLVSGAKPTYLQIIDKRSVHSL